MKYTLTVFDLDGTLLNTLDDLASSLNYALGAFGFPEKTVSEVRRFVGDGRKKLVWRSLPGRTAEEMSQKVLEAFSNHYKEHCTDSTRPYEGIIELLNKLKSMNVKTAVLSNKSDFEVQALTRRYFDGLIDISAGEREGVRKKPYPDSLNNMLRKMKTDPESTLYIGDSEVDIQTAKNSGVSLAIVDWGFRDRDFLIKNGAETVVSTPQELLEFILAEQK